MTSGAAVRSELRNLYLSETAAIEQEFSVTGEGRAAVARRTALVDSIVQRLWNGIIVGSQPASANPSSALALGPKNFALVATGGFGRGSLSPTPILICCFCMPAATPRMNSKIPSGTFRRSCGTFS